MTIQPTLAWYTEESTRKNLTPRCPFASVHRCPRYYQSRSLLGISGFSTRIDASEDERLLRQWQATDLWPSVAEEETSIGGPTTEPRLFSCFCPEVAFDRFGWFASYLARHADEIDSEVAATHLRRESASPNDWRWDWATVSPLHYADCSLYSPLSLGIHERHRTGKNGF